MSRISSAPKASHLRGLNRVKPCRQDSIEKRKATQCRNAADTASLALKSTATIAGTERQSLRDMETARQMVLLGVNAGMQPPLDQLIAAIERHCKALPERSQCRQKLERAKTLIEESACSPNGKALRYALGRLERAINWVNRYLDSFISVNPPAKRLRRRARSVTPRAFEVREPRLKRPFISMLVMPEEVGQTP